MFSKKDLKTGFVVSIETESGVLENAMVLLGTRGGDIIAGGGVWFPLDQYNNKELFEDLVGSFKIIAVYSPKNNANFANFINAKHDITHGYELIWERETPKQKQLRELQETIQKAQEQIEKLQNE